MEFSNTMRDHLQFMCHLRMVDYQIFTKWRMSSDLIINAPPFFCLSAQVILKKYYLGFFVCVAQR